MFTFVHEPGHAESEKLQRRGKLLALAAENEREKVIEAIQGGQHRGGAAAAADDEEEDPLEAFMKANEAGVSKEKEKAEAHQRAWDAQYAGKDVEICEKIEEEKTMHL